MQEPAISPPTRRLAAGFVAAPLVAATAYGALNPLAATDVPILSGTLWSAGIYALVAMPMALVLGIPAFAALRSRVKPTVVNAALTGAAIAAVPWFIIGLLVSLSVQYGHEQDGQITWQPAIMAARGWLELIVFAAEIAAAGALGGLVFWALVAAGAKRAG